MLLEGMQLGRYRLARLLGSGGMGEVYLGDDTHIRRQVAIKVTRAEATPYPNSDTAKEAARLFQREVRAIATLDHPYILPLFDYGEHDMEATMLTYMVMPYRAEGSLSTWLRQHGDKQALSAQELAHFIRQAASALAYAHQHQIIHQDVKPSNFLIRSNDISPALPDLLLADFGVAKFTSASASVSQSSRGTPTYMAPEQWSGHPVAASDQYALAIMTYQLLTGSLPFRGRMEQVMYMHFTAQTQPPSALNPRISKEVDQVILKALAKKPEERFASISAFANAIQQALSLPELPKITNSQNVSSQPGVVQTPNAPAASIADIHATLAISRNEATSGATRSLNLPGGRRITVPIPSGIPDGQVIRLERQGDSASDGSKGALVLTFTIAPDETRQAAYNGNENKTVLSDPNSPKMQALAANITASSRIRTQFRRLRLPRGRVAFIIGLVVLIVLVSSGIIFFANNTNNTNIANIPNPYPPNIGTLALNDPLTDNSRGYSWDENAGCIFKTDGYHAVSQNVPSSILNSCTATNSNFANFTYQVQMKIIQGETAGIIFRADSGRHTNYYFGIDTLGTYILYIYNNGNYFPTTVSGGNPAINTGLNSSNMIAVVANGSQFVFYVNNQRVDSVTDSTYSQGEIGVTVDASTDQTEAVFSNARVWTF